MNRHGHPCSTYHRESLGHAGILEEVAPDEGEREVLGEEEEQGVGAEGVGKELPAHPQLRQCSRVRQLLGA